MAPRPPFAYNSAMLLWLPLLLTAWFTTALACFRLCHAAIVAARKVPEDAVTGVVPTLQEAAYLAGGPGRVVDLTLVSMALDRRLLLAHTGWATVVDPVGRDALERAVIAAAGAERQARTTTIRAAVSAGEAVRTLAGRLVDAGLALADPSRTSVQAAVRGLQRAALVVLATGTTAHLVLEIERHALLFGWFALPMLLALLCLGIARFEIHPYTHWAAPAGQQLLAGVSTREEMAALAVHGVPALRDPELRTALKGH